MAVLTIGMPLHNNARTLRAALDSLRAQTFAEFRLLMSDDCSTDGTVAIAEQYCSLDPRFVLVRQPRNLNYGNFRYVLAQADTEFFMFAAGDDSWHPEFASECIAALRGDPRAVVAVSKVAFTTGESLEKYAAGTHALTGAPHENICWFLRNPNDNSRMYGVFRTSVAKRSFPAGDHHAYDWTFSIRTLLFGTHLELSQCLMYRDETPADRYLEYVRRDGKLLLRIFPLLGMTFALLRVPGFWRQRGVLRALAWANLRAHLLYTRRFHFRSHQMSWPLLGRLLRWF